MKTKVAAIILTFYLAILLFVNATILERHTLLVCFDIGTAVILLGAALLGSDDDGRA